MLSVFPVEVLLEIIQWLPFGTVGSLSALSKSWSTFMETNESSIYHNMSKRYGYIPKGDSNPADPPEGWKAWCEYPPARLVGNRITILQSSIN